MEESLNKCCILVANLCYICAYDAFLNYMNLFIIAGIWSSMVIAQRQLGF